MNGNDSHLFGISRKTGSAMSVRDGVRDGIEQPRKRLTVRPLHWAACLAFAGSHAAFAQETPASATPEASERALPAVKVTAAQDTEQHLKEDVSSGALGARS